VALVERYAKEQGLWRYPGVGPDFDALLELDLGSVVPSLAGPRRPQDRVPLDGLRADFRANFPPGSGATVTAAVEPPLPIEGVVEVASADTFPASDPPSYARGGDRQDETELTPPLLVPSSDDPYPAVRVQIGAVQGSIRTGSVAIAAITSCTNTSNPTVMVGAGLLARNAVARGLTVDRTVKTSLAPGSRAVTGYLEAAGLMAPLEQLGFALAGFGCTTCIGNSGPLDESIARAIDENDLVVAAVLSGNRNFEGRIHPLARASYLASPPLVVAFAIAGRVDIDLSTEPLGLDRDGRPVMLEELWPGSDEIRSVISASIDPALFRRTYAGVFEGDDRWRALPTPADDRYVWDASSTYVARPPFFDDVTVDPPAVRDIHGARVLVVLGDSVTTDHISPAGSIAPWSPAGRWLQEQGVGPLEFNSYGARRGHHEVMMRGTFGNVRLRNRLIDGKEGPFTVHLPDGEEQFIYDAAMRYRDEGVPLVVLAGREYGSGSSRDWAAKGTSLLGIRAVIAESYERIHRSNLVGMGVLPLEFLPRETPASIGLTGLESYSIKGIAGSLAPRCRLAVIARSADGHERQFEVLARLDGPIDVDYYRHGGILPAVLRGLSAEH
jgi:aconitate hydratase